MGLYASYPLPNGYLLKFLWKNQIKSKQSNAGKNAIPCIRNWLVNKPYGVSLVGVVESHDPNGIQSCVDGRTEGEQLDCQLMFHFGLKMQYHAYCIVL